MMFRKKISGGVYLVVDPSLKEEELLEKLLQTVDNEIAAVQVWDHFPPSAEIENILNKICEVCHSHNVPVLMNNVWQLVDSTAMDGVHFDEIPKDFDRIKERLDNNCIMGITVNNDLSIVEWAEKNKLDYISFCSVFPSSTSNSCELVTFDKIKKTRSMIAMPIFLAGGIKPENIDQLKELDFEGVAVVSGIMNADDPEKAKKNYLTELRKIRDENRNYK